MKISREDQKQFAQEIINICERNASPETLASLSKVVYLLMSWVGEENEIAVNLSEYIYELEQIANGGKDTGWKDEFRAILEKSLSS